MSATDIRLTAGSTESGIPVRVGLKLPPPAPPRVSLRLKIFLAAALLILIAVGGAIAVSTYQARRVADGVFLARDLVNEPPNVLSPVEFARRAKALASTGLKVEVLGEAAMK